MMTSDIRLGARLEFGLRVRSVIFSATTMAINTADNGRFEGVAFRSSSVVMDAASLAQPTTIRITWFTMGLIAHNH